MSPKSLPEIFRRLQEGRAQVATAAEIYQLAREKGIPAVLEQVDAAVTACFSPLSGGALVFRLPRVTPGIRVSEGIVNGIPLSLGPEGCDLYLPVPALPGTDSANKIFPGEFSYGGGHVIEDLVNGKEVFIEAAGYGSDAYPRRRWEGQVKREQMERAEVIIPVPAGDRPLAAANLSSRTIYTQLGILKSNLGNVNYLGSGIYSPFLRDPQYQGLSRGLVFAAGAQAKVWPRPGGGYLLSAPAGNMQPRWVRGLSMLGFGVAVQVAVAVVIPVVDENDLQPLLMGEEDITITVIEMSEAFPQGKEEALGRFTFTELHSGSITIRGKETVTAPLSSYAGAREYAGRVKEGLMEGSLAFQQPEED